MLGSRGIFKRPRDFFPDCDVGAKQDLRRPGGRATTFRCNFKHEYLFELDCCENEEKDVFLSITTKT